MSKSKRADENKRIDKRTLIRTHKEFKEFPNKIFVCSDFGQINKFREKYLNTLISLNIIEKLGVEYACGNNCRREVIGYRLINTHTHLLPI